MVSRSEPSIIKLLINIERLISRKFWFLIFFVNRMVAALIFTDPLIDLIGGVLAKYVETLSDYFWIGLL